MLLEHCGQHEPALMLSESGTYRLLSTYFQPENRYLRHWLSAELPRDTEQPYLSRLHWPELDVPLLYWQSEPWIKLSDMPRLLQPDHIESGHVRPGHVRPSHESTPWRQRISARWSAWFG